MYMSTETWGKFGKGNKNVVVPEKKMKWEDMEETKRLIRGLELFCKDYLEKHLSNSPVVKDINEKIKALQEKL